MNKPLTISGAYRQTRDLLLGLYPERESTSLSNVLFRDLLGISPDLRVLNPGSMLPEHQAIALQMATRRLLSHEPIQYIIGKKRFLDADISVKPGVLIPRGETEQLVSWTIDRIQALSPGNNLHILDVACGSGCIATALAMQFPTARVFALDKFEDAVEMTKHNALNNNVSVSASVWDVFDSPEQFPWPDVRFDLLISNPPYVTDSEQALMAPNVLEYEPHHALFVPDCHPLVYYRAIAGLGRLFLKPGGMLSFEINEAFGSEMMQLLIMEGYNNPVIANDIHEKPRFAAGWLPVNP